MVQTMAFKFLLIWCSIHSLSSSPVLLYSQHMDLSGTHTYLKFFALFSSFYTICIPQLFASLPQCLGVSIPVLVSCWSLTWPLQLALHDKPVSPTTNPLLFLVAVSLHSYYLSHIYPFLCLSSSTTMYTPRGPKNFDLFNSLLSLCHKSDAQ